MTYEEQLNSDQWKSKRVEILMRDSYRCQKCNNKNYLENYSLAISFGRIDNLTKSIFCQVINTLDILHVFCYYETIRIERGNFILYERNNIKNDLIGVLDLKAEINNSYAGSLDVYSETNFFTTNLSKNGILDSLDYLSWNYLYNLHIHHLYYQINKKAWEYPNDALQTLCWECHELLHKNTTINIMDEYGLFLEEKVVCSRCYGAGYFPEYKHVEHGVCFRCKGSRFE
ncbi:MAG: hypothetical protein KA270_00855 [Saprospiraceae bacterium]|nr:hypothetical protein [Saprospiraceae bacterium]MBP6565678.1 hypothetical protein [Saprospiraceae bacterium]